MKFNTTKWILGITFLWALLMTYNDMVVHPEMPNWVKLIPAFLGAVIVLWFFRRALVPLLTALIKTLFGIVFAILKFILIGWRPVPGARYLNFLEEWQFFRNGDGWLINGKGKRLKSKISFQSCVTIAGMGAGKTSSFILPNALNCPKNRSLVLTDLSGELYEQASGYLKKRGFEIVILNLMDLQRSHAYNPLLEANSHTEIQQLAHLLVKSAPSSMGDDGAFWNSGAEKILRVIITCLRNQGDETQRNLGVVREKLSQFNPNTEGQNSFTQWVSENTISDQSTWVEFKSLLVGNEKTIQSFITTADIALLGIADPALAALTSQHEINFQQLRKKPTALFVMARSQDSAFQFLLNVFLTQLFNALMKDMTMGGLPVYCLLDEFGNQYIPNASRIFTQCRKYKIAAWIILQSLSQLEINYKKAESQTILDGIRTQIFLAGMDLNTAEMISRRLGKKRPQFQKDRVEYADQWLLNPDELVTLGDSEALLLHGNKRPYRYKVCPYFKHPKLSQRAKMKPAPLPTFKLSEPEEEPEEIEIESEVQNEPEPNHTTQP